MGSIPPALGDKSNASCWAKSCVFQRARFGRKFNCTRGRIARRSSPPYSPWIIRLLKEFELLLVLHIKELLLDCYDNSGHRKPGQIELEQIIQRSTTAISIVTPICYAHLAAVSQFLKFDESSERSSSHIEGTAPAVPELPVLHKVTCSSMFF